MDRLFKPGDRVQLRHGGPTMEVIKYTLDHPSKKQEGVFSDHHVECVWYEEDKRKKEVFDQRTLFKVENGGGLYKD